MLDIHPKAEARLKQLLEERLERLVVNKGMFIDYLSARELKDLDNVLSRGDAARDALVAAVGEKYVSGFVEDRLIRWLDSKYGYDGDAEPRSLASFEKLGTLSEIADRLVSELLSLPWSYSFFVRLPNGIAEPSSAALGAEVIRLTDSTRLIPARPSLNQHFPNPGPLGHFKGLWGLSFPFGTESEWPESGYFLHYIGEGYVSRADTGQTFEDTQNWFRAICGLGLAYSLFQKGYEYFPQQPDIKTSVFIWQDGKWVHHETKSLSREVSETLLNLRIGDWLTKSQDTSQDRLVRAGWSFVRNGMRAAEADERLFRATQWFFDSHSSTSELLGFVQATVVLEILLGDKAASDAIGLGELLRNRCAYLIGTSSAEREIIMSDFNRIYDTRSKIVHSGKSYLTSSEMEDLWRLRDLCSKVIVKEVEMRASKPKAT